MLPQHIFVGNLKIVLNLTLTVFLYCINPSTNDLALNSLVLCLCTHALLSHSTRLDNHPLSGLNALSFTVNLQLPANQMEGIKTVFSISSNRDTLMIVDGTI